MFKKIQFIMKKVLPTFIVFGCFVILYIFLISTKEEVENKKLEEQTWTVSLVKAKEFTTKSFEETFGTIKASRHANLRFGLSGEITQISDKMKNGFNVMKGEILAKLDTKDIDLELENIRTKIGAEKIQIRELKKQVLLRKKSIKSTEEINIRKYKSNLEDTIIKINAKNLLINSLKEQTKLKEKSLYRIKNMASKNVASESSLEEIQLSFSSIKNQLSQALAELEQLKIKKINFEKDLDQTVKVKVDEARMSFSISSNQLSQSEFNLKQLKINEKKLLQNLDESTISAPFDGILSDVNMAIGNRVSNNTQVAVLTDLNSLEVSFVVSNKIYSNYPKLNNQIVEIIWESNGTEVSRANAKITRAESIINKKDGGGRLYADLPKSDLHNIPLGAFVKVNFYGGDLKNVIELPEEALFENNYIFINKNGRTKKIFVEVLHRKKGTIWVKGNVKEGDQVVATRLPGIGNGIKIKSSTSIN